jgi:APA family basic amino acid/polyamine antiporter
VNKKKFLFCLSLFSIQSTFMKLFRKKPLSLLMADAGDTEKGLKRTLGPGAVIALGIGAIIGAGLFARTAVAAAQNAGPSITIGFIIAAIGCAFAGLCYAEFASMIPVAGSAYTYSYATMGELVAWVIGWDLILEYGVGAATVSSYWSQYFNKFLSIFGTGVPYQWCHSPFEVSESGVHGIINIPAITILLVLTLLLIRGTKGSAAVNNIIVFIKVAIVIIFIAIGWSYIRPEYHTPFIPEPTKFVDAQGVSHNFGGIMGILGAAGVVFFAFIGFDAVSTAAQEAKNPKKNNADRNPWFSCNLYCTIHIFFLCTYRRCQYK